MDLLSEASPFRFLPEHALQALRRDCPTVFFNEGEPLMRQGDYSDALYFITRGRAQVEKTAAAIKHPIVLGEIEPGGIAGEIGVLSGQPRSATVVAMEDTEAVKISVDRLARLIAAYPFVAVELQAISRERRRATAEVLNGIEGRTQSPRQLQPLHRA